MRNQCRFALQRRPERALLLTPINGSRPLRILYVSPRQCWPPVSGAKLRDYHFLRALGTRFELTCIFYRDPVLSAPDPAELPFCRTLVAVPKPAAYTAGKIARGFAGRWPLPVLNYTSPAMAEALERTAALMSFDVVHLDSIHMAAHAQRLRGRHVYDWHNIESEAMQRYGESTRSLPHRLYARLTADRMRALEARLLRSAFGHIVCSEREREALLAREPGARVAVVPNGVDTAHCANAGQGPADKPRIVFVGSMNYQPNVEAAVAFARETWPTVRERLPRECTLALVGADPVPAVRALAALPGVEVTGTVPDVRPWYGGALAAVVPLRSGGGTRLKILEAMAAGVPVVSTPLGAEGLHVTDGRDILLLAADDQAGWARALGDLAASQDRRRELAVAALDLVRRRYDWGVVGAALADLYECWAELPS